MNDLQKRFIGTWELVESKTYQDDGSVVYPFGKDAIGKIIYDANDVMAVQITSQHRHGECDKSITDNYLAYFGRYSIDEDNNLVSHHLEGHLRSEFVGKTVVRQISFNNGLLVLRPYEDGTCREIIWRKLS